MPRKAIPEQRKEQLIVAAFAFETIGAVGIASVTLSQVARQVGMSTGIVSHYFGDKDGLLNATMRHILRDLHNAVAARDTPKAQLFAIIEGNFHPSQTSGASMRTWLDFWALSLHQPELRRLQRVNEHRLFSNICCQFRRELPCDAARRAAHGLAAMIDGLWLRGSLSGLDFNARNASETAFDYAESMLDNRILISKPTDKRNSNDG